MSANVEDILNRLDDVRPRGPGQWKALCPAHDDRNPSLSVTKGDDGRPLLHCFAGCTYPDIMAALGLSTNGNGVATPVAAKRPKATKTTATGRIVATYDYQDAAGRVLFQKVRYEPKSFSIRRPDDRGGFIWGLGDVAPVLYRLPELIDPATALQPVYFCEGEKDSDRVAALDLVATCNFDGAAAAGQRSRWRPEYNEHFHERIVHVLADNDDAGRAHAESIAGNLHGIAQAVKVVNLSGLPPKGDVSDWLDAGHTKAELEHLCLLTPKWEPAADVRGHETPLTSMNSNGAAVAPDAARSNTPLLEVSSKPVRAIELLAHKFKPQIPLVEGLIAKGNFGALAARAKSGKTILMLCMTMSIDAGTPFLGRDTTQARVLYYALEDGARRVQQRLLSFNWQPSERAAFLFSIAHLDDGQGGPGPGIAEIWGHTKDYDLIVVDTLTAAMSGRTDERDNSSMGAIFNALAQVAHDSDTAILIVHHTGKALNPDDVFATLRGASAIRGAYDLGLVLERKPGEREAILHVESRDMDVRPMTIRQAENGAGWEYLGDSNELDRVRAGRKVLETMLEHDARGDGMTAKQLADIREVSEATIHKQLTRLESSGYVCRKEQPSTQMGKRPDIWRVADRYR